MIEEVTKTKSGKALRVKFNGAWYGAFLDSGLDGAVGRMVDVAVTPDKGFGLGLGQWKYSQEVVPPPGQPAQQPAPSQPAPTPVAQSASGRLAESELRFVSNQLNAAIASKSVTTFEEMSVLAKQLKTLVREL
jgi:hypothetical protein